MSQLPIVLAITGASGAAYAVRLLEVLLAAGSNVHLAISPAGALVLRQELGLAVDLDKFDPASLMPSRGSPERLTELARALFGVRHEGRAAPVAAGIGGVPGTVQYHHFQNLMAPIASGSFLTAGMVVCPCSGGTLGAIVHGMGENLIHRAASVQLKERRKLILVPRETPLSLIQLDNLRRAAEAGAVVLPAMPGFYHNPTSMRDLVDFVVARICDQLGVTNALMHRWGT